MGFSISAEVGDYSLSRAFLGAPSAFNSLRATWKNGATHCNGSTGELLAVVLVSN